MLESLAGIARIADHFGADGDSNACRGMDRQRYLAHPYIDLLIYIRHQHFGCLRVLRTDNA